MSAFGWWATVVLVWEGLGLLTGPRRWPPTITDFVRGIDPGWFQGAVSLAFLLPPFAHLVEWIA